MSLIFRTIILLVIWEILTEGNHKSLVIGIPVVISSVLALSLLTTRTTVKFNVLYLSRFIPWFILKSLHAGIDIVTRVCLATQEIRINPGFLHYPVSLPDGAPRIFFINTVSLIPGTVSGDCRKNILEVHVLDTQQDNVRDLKELEEKIGLLFNFDFESLSKKEIAQ